MKNVAKVALISILSLFVLAGCGSNSAESAAVGFYEAMQKGDVDKYKKLSTSNTQGVMAFAFGMKCMGQNLDDDKVLSSCMKETADYSKVEVVSVDEKSENLSIVTLSIHGDDGNVKEEQVKIKKVDNDWKVDISK